jgi:hypothetical protein
MQALAARTPSFEFPVVWVCVFARRATPSPVQCRSSPLSDDRVLGKRRTGMDAWRDCAQAGSELRHLKMPSRNAKSRDCAQAWTRNAPPETAKSRNCEQETKVESRTRLTSARVPALSGLSKMDPARVPALSGLSKMN